MAAVNIAEMRTAESAALAAGWTEEQLLELAGERLGRAIARFFPQPGTAIGYLGKGHNAGDTLVALGVLRDTFGWKIAIRPAWHMEECTPLTRQKWASLGAASIESIPTHADLIQPLILLDGLLGSGASGGLRDPLRLLAEEMTWLREHAGARIAAVDLPSGIDADTGKVFPGAVTADVTFMIANAKRGLLSGAAAASTGALALIPLEALEVRRESDIELIAPQTLAYGKSPRPFDFHKGNAGRVSIVAGSQAYTGAAALASIGALRAGSGLITLHVPAEIVPLVISRCPPEVIIHGFDSMDELEIGRSNAWVIGCGLGSLGPTSGQQLIELIQRIGQPAIIDADALNEIAQAGRLDIFRESHILTPHPGEFARLAPDLADLSREEAAREFARRTPATLLLKGCRTIVTRHGSPLWCNSTGNPGMATGGQGDLLAGVIGSLLASGNTTLHAAALSAWLCGRAAEIAMSRDAHSEESLAPTDVARCLGSAFTDWKTSAR